MSARSTGEEYVDRVRTSNTIALLKVDRTIKAIESPNISKSIVVPSRQYLLGFVCLPNLYLPARQFTLGKLLNPVRLNPLGHPFSEGTCHCLLGGGIGDRLLEFRRVAHKA
jgi:hypothetical protein